ncbi:YolD-like family protein [Paenibacillus filicis]|uniref:YolD-like family protein n=1 Tax=Paenibacillus gyeongsangnamensis TaxID=3388067 RepID=A0ABT4Q3A8_9BACL|nr:YolD-like family protein [Paenibacillus filicis]MCZ8511321.1 YolD-like family protein [Paenibacillus filicis]
MSANPITRRSRPVRDDRTLESLIHCLGIAMFLEKEAVVTVWSDFEDQTFQGNITKLDKQLKSIKIQNKNEYAWVDFEQVLKIEIVNKEE